MKKVRTKHNCKCFTCKFSRAFEIKGHLTKGVTGNALRIICVRDSFIAGDTGDKPKLHCDWRKKGAPLDSYYLTPSK